MLDRLALKVHDLVDRHLAATNPHGITKTTISLGNVTNDAQAKADFTGYTEKTSLDDDDLIILADSGASNAIKKIKKSNMNINSRWTAVTGFNDQPYSTSKIDVTGIADHGASMVGKPIKFKLSGSYYYAIGTSTNTPDFTNYYLNIAGAPLTTGDGDLTELYVGTPEMIRQEVINIPGYWADGASSTLLASDLKIALRWGGAAAYLVRMEAWSNTDDSGANKARVNVTVAGNAVLTTNTNAGLEIAADATWYSSVVDINTSNYDISILAGAIELSTDANGSNDDSSDLTVILTFILE